MRLHSLKDWGYQKQVANEGHGLRQRSSIGIEPGIADRDGLFYLAQQRARSLLIRRLFIFTPLLFLCSFAVVYTALNSMKAQTKPLESAAAAPVTAEKEAGAVMILVPVRDIEAGRKLEPALFSKVKRSASLVPATALLDYTQLRHKYAKYLLKGFYPILADGVTDERPLNSVVSNIPEGHRAVTITVNPNSAVEGWATAGAMVDVQWISDIEGERVAKIIVENAKVLSAERIDDPDADPSEKIPTTVTLMTDETNAQKISLASTQGQLMLHLRGFRDKGKSNSSLGSITFNDLLGTPRVVAPKKDLHLEGYASVRDANGKLNQFAVMNGQLIRKRGD